MVSPNKYIGITYLHLLASSLTVGVTSQKLVSDWKYWPLVSGILSFILLFVVLFLKVGFLKYIAFFLYLSLVGQNLHVVFKSLKESNNNLMNKVIGGSVGFFIAMSIVGFMDKGGILSWGKYLFAGLIGLLVGYLGVFISSLTHMKEGVIEKMKDGLALISLFLFSAFIAYDTKVLQMRARRPENPPDYIDASINLFLDILNIFVSLNELAE
jgi:FtsH-binding integral membrane protein